jgi:hypothetical protein
MGDHQRDSVARRPMQPRGRQRGTHGDHGDEDATLPHHHTATKGGDTGFGASCHRHDSAIIEGALGWVFGSRRWWSPGWNALLPWLIDSVRRRLEPPSSMAELGFSVTDAILGKLTPGPAVMIDRPPPPAAPMSDHL